MPNDQYGRPVVVGDAVIIKGKLTVASEDPNYLNCTVLLDQQLPPSGAEMTIQLNTQQLVKDELPDPRQQQAGSGQQQTYPNYPNPNYPNY